MKHISKTTIACLLAGTSILGCGSDVEMPELGAVTGVVTLDGEPVPNASLLFCPVQGGRPGNGSTDENGNYTITFSAQAEGAMVGMHDVSVSTFQPEMGDPGQDGYTQEQPETIPQKYSKDEPLQFEVKTGDNVINIELTR